MTTVALIVTGQLEKLALGTSLGQMFSDVEFSTERSGDGFTSGRVSLPLPDRQTNADKLARRMIAAVDPGRGATPADYAVVVDDLELENLDQPGTVLAYFRQAVTRQLEGYWPSRARRDKTRDKVRQRCSFHLLVPMVESYFYAEAQALTRAGAQRASTVDPTSIDIEQFDTDDADFLRPASGAYYWATDQRNRHPKCYLQFLCDPQGTGNGRYRETRGGVGALANLDWTQVLAPAESVKYVRSLVHDLANALGEPTPGAGRCHEATELGAGQGVLRNL